MHEQPQSLCSHAWQSDCPLACMNAWISVKNEDTDTKFGKNVPVRHFHYKHMKFILNIYCLPNFKICKHTQINMFIFVLIFVLIVNNLLVDKWLLDKELMLDNCM